MARKPIPFIPRMMKTLPEHVFVFSSMYPEPGTAQVTATGIRLALDPRRTWYLSFQKTSNKSATYERQGQVLVGSLAREIETVDVVGLDLT